MRARLSAAYGSARYRQGRVREAVTWARTAIEHAELADDRPALAHALRLIELCLDDLGDPQRLEFRGRSLPIYEELDDQVGLADELDNLGVFALGEGRLHEALELFGRARCGPATSRRRGGGGRRDEQRRRGASRPGTDRRGDRAAPAGFAHAAIRRPPARDSDRACQPRTRLGASGPMSTRRSTRLDESVAAADSLNAAFFGREIRVRKVEALVVGGRDEAALALAEELVPLGTGAFEERFVAMLHRLRGWSLLRLGRLDEATAAIDEALHRAEAISVGYEIALAAPRAGRRYIDAWATIAGRSTTLAPTPSLPSWGPSAHRRCCTNRRRDAGAPSGICMTMGPGARRDRSKGTMREGPMLPKQISPQDIAREKSRASRAAVLRPTKPAAIRAHFASVPLFAGCSTRELKLLTRSAVIEARATGATLMAQGEVGANAFMILQGTCRVVRNGRRVNEVGPGGVVGELSMLNRAPRNATVVAETPLEVAILRRRDFLELLDQAPSISRKLLETLAARVQILDARTPV